MQVAPSHHHELFKEPIFQILRPRRTESDQAVIRALLQYDSWECITWQPTRRAHLRGSTLSEHHSLIRDAVDRLQTERKGEGPSTREPKSPTHIVEPVPDVPLPQAARYPVFVRLVHRISHLVRHRASTTVPQNHHDHWCLARSRLHIRSTYSICRDPTIRLPRQQSVRRHSTTRCNTYGSALLLSTSGNRQVRTKSAAPICHQPRDQRCVVLAIPIARGGFDISFIFSYHQS